MIISNTKKISVNGVIFISVNRASLPLFVFIDIFFTQLTVLHKPPFVFFGHILTILGTIGGVAPFLGLFGTVVRILFTFQDLAAQGNQSAAVASGIASALIATAFGLGVAIVAVIFYNSFQSIVKRYEDDFQLIRLLFLSFVDSNDESTTPSNANISL